MISYGKFEVRNNVIIITDLPVGLWPIKYKAWLIKLEKEKKITTFKNNSVKDYIHFEIYGFKETPTLTSLRLKKTIGMSNMTLLDENDKPTTFDTAYDILEVFFHWRLAVYARRKNYILTNSLIQINHMKEMIRFIQAVIDKKIKIRNVQKKDVYEAMATMNLEKSLYDKATLRNISQDEIKDLLADIAKKEQEIINLQNTTIEQMWLKDLEELSSKYISIYGNDCTLTATAGGGSSSGNKNKIKIVKAKKDEIVDVKIAKPKNIIVKKSVVQPVTPSIPATPVVPDAPATPVTPSVPATSSVPGFPVVPDKKIIVKKKTN
jgi:DNA gyrase/topoisomerase IV subunit A